METHELLSTVVAGEDSRNQFKADVNNAGALGAEMVAFANGSGGRLFIGVHDDGTIAGLQREDVGRINQLIANAATNCVRPPINPATENVVVQNGLVIVVTIDPGVAKPYMDTQGYIWVKSGADKRRVTAREEMQRMFQAAALIHADETPIHGSSMADVDTAYFDEFFATVIGETVEQQTLSRANLLHNMNLMADGELNVCGMLLLGKNPQRRLPTCMVKAVAFPGTDIADEHYRDSQDIGGKLADVFQKTLNFVLANIHHVQQAQGFNSTGEPEIPRIALEELIANALMHRDYFISAPVRVLIFADRVEILSPGHLPNNLTVANIKLGNTNIRNPILASYATKILPYRGLGSGILRALQAYPAMDFVDDKEGNLFKVVIKREPTVGSS